MIIPIIGIITGILVLCTGGYYSFHEREDPESRKIYTKISAVGALAAVLCTIWLLH